MTAATSFSPIAEQLTALDLFKTGASLAIEAGAGAGKTSTLILLANSTNRRGQYIAFNKAIVTEAAAKMPQHVAANTAHALAFRSVGKRYAHRLRGGRLKSMELANRLGLDPITVTVQDGNRKRLDRSYLAGLVMRSVERFCQSADPEPTERHVPYIDGIDVPPGAYENNRLVAAAIVPAMRRAWADLVDPRGSLPYKHSHYLKAWQLSNPRIDAEFILFDEAQDANPVMVAVVAAQTHAQLVWVGDSQQQIYSFTGAVNALASVPAEQRAYLTQSFRFGPAVAEVANRVLNALDAELRIVGTESIPSVVEPVADPDGLLTRTNAAAVRHVLGAIEAGTPVHLVGGGGEVVAFARAARDLMSGGRTEHPDLACFDSWTEVREYVAQDEQGGDLRLLVSLVDEFGVDVILNALDRMPREEDAELIVSTAHKSKGREWAAVQLAEDFPAEPTGEELRLLYVAVTRARLRLDVSAVGCLTGEGLLPGEAADEIAAMNEQAAEQAAADEDDLVLDKDESVLAEMDEGDDDEGEALPLNEAAQLAMGELGEALMSDGDAKNLAIARAVDYLRRAVEADNAAQGPLSRPLPPAGPEGDREAAPAPADPEAPAECPPFVVSRNGDLMPGVEADVDLAVARARDLYTTLGGVVAVHDNRGDLVVQMEA